MKYLLTAFAVVAMLASGAAYAAGSSSTTTTFSATSAFPKAKTLVDARNFTAAIPLLKKIVKSQPKNADAWNLLVFSNRKLQKFDVALQQYQKALQIKPTHKGANEYLGELYLKVGDLPKAQEQLTVLNDMCTHGFVGCEEYNELKEKVAKFIASKGS